METAIPAQSMSSTQDAPRPASDEDRPRERLARQGAGALSSRELLALLRGTGSARASVLDTAGRLLDGGIRGLAQRSLGDLETEHGLGRAKATRVLAALELGAWLASEGRASQPVLRTPADSGRYLRPRYAARPVEAFGPCALDGP